MAHRQKRLELLQKRLDRKQEMVIRAEEAPRELNSKQERTDRGEAIK